VLWDSHLDAPTFGRRLLENDRCPPLASDACAGAFESGGVSLAAAQAHAERQKQKGNDNFYRAQAREQRKSELLELQKRYGDAKKHLRSMREARHFKHA
jgi:Ribosomal RNA-processing protein 7 (RRP7) C-terminal domain